MDTLKVAGNLESLKKIAQFVQNVAQKANLNKKKTYRLRLAVDEIATNIISYNPDIDDQDDFIQISSYINNKQLFISIEDKGSYFNPYSQISSEIKNIDQSIKDRPVGKLGIYLAMDGVDEFIYKRNHDRNYNILILNLDTE